MKNHYEIFQNRLREKRKNQGLTQSELAEISGLNAGDWISHFETGRRKPNFDHLIALSKALKTSIDYLVGN